MSFSEPLATILHAIDLVKDLQETKVLVQGAGVLGLLFAKVLKALYNCDITVSDPDLNRHPFILQEKVKAIVPEDREQYQVIFDCTGNANAVGSCVPHLANHGQLIIFGVCQQNSSITVNPFEIYKRELSIQGVFALNNNLEQAASLIDEGKLDLQNLISGVITRADLIPTFEKLASRELSGKYIVRISK
jgi:2-desacetyl-2-hydroxyethyl bacteriochlorophyllide A dehydrogenase